MNKVMRLLEANMKMEQVLQSFMLDLEVDSKNASVAGQELDMCLKLMAPEDAHKPWNRYKQFLLFLEQRHVSGVLFAYKDSRFRCLSRAAAVLIHHYDHLSQFLSQNPQITHRLACLVRSDGASLPQGGPRGVCLPGRALGGALLCQDHRERFYPYTTQGVL